MEFRNNNATLKHQNRFLGSHDSQRRAHDTLHDVLRRDTYRRDWRER